MEYHVQRFESKVYEDWLFNVMTGCPFLLTNELLMAHEQSDRENKNIKSRNVFEN